MDNQDNAADADRRSSEEWTKFFEDGGSMVSSVVKQLGQLHVRGTGLLSPTTWEFAKAYFQAKDQFQPKDSALEKPSEKVVPASKSIRYNRHGKEVWQCS
ncbi:hypothetical protein MMC32_007064 [Xylographa parallela]|nr:hypothetical protein [Xylographa parallela]